VRPLVCRQIAALRKASTTVFASVLCLAAARPPVCRHSAAIRKAPSALIAS
jgi:hypothetical protein